jgi:hypothetical protein
MIGSPSLTVTAPEPVRVAFQEKAGSCGKLYDAQQQIQADSFTGTE